MAEDHERVPHMESEDPNFFSLNILEGSGLGQVNEFVDSATHWCHHCNTEAAFTPDANLGVFRCTRCDIGFVDSFSMHQYLLAALPVVPYSASSPEVVMADRGDRPAETLAGDRPAQSLSTTTAAEHQDPGAVLLGIPSSVYSPGEVQAHRGDRRAETHEDEESAAQQSWFREYFEFDLHALGMELQGELSTLRELLNETMLLGDHLEDRDAGLFFEQMEDNENLGAQPAAKSAVDGLPTIAIEQRHLEAGKVVCTICLDDIAIGEPAKQLSCLHFYHNDCILPWLSSHNSCPVCRYELPADNTH